MVNNVRGVKSKEIMIKRIIAEEEPVIIALVETKLKEKEGFTIPGYEITRVDRIGDGGGVLLAYKQSLRKVIVRTAEYRMHDAEILWERLDNGFIKLKIGVIYMPQESRTRKAKLKEIYEVIEEEVLSAQQKGECVLILGDLNCKVGGMIKGNNNEITKGGKLLLKMTKKCKLAILNAEECCSGLWTRIEGSQKSVLDYVLVSEEHTNLVRSMEIDEAKDITPYYVEKGDNGDETKYTDHCMMTATMNISLLREKSKTYTMVMDENGWAKYRHMLEEENVSDIINNCDITTTYPIWRCKVSEILDQCRKKVKIRKRWKVSRKLTSVKKSITRKLKGELSEVQVKELKMKREIIKQQIEDEEHKKERTRIHKIVEMVKKGGGVKSNVFWEVMRKLKGKQEEIAYAVRDKEGKLCETPLEIKQVHADWFKELLTIRPGESRLEKQAEEIMEMVWRSMKALADSQPPRVTTKEEIEVAMKKLDPKKAKDAKDWKNDVIKEGGNEMAESLVKIMNKVDQQKLIPQEWQIMEIKAIPKTGIQSQMGNKRGLFLTNNVSKVYETVVKNRNDEEFREGITVWHAGGIKERAGIDIVMAATSVLEQNNYLKRHTYLVFTDAEKCFDKLWLKDCIYELWRCGTDVRDCCMIKRLNTHAEVVVKTPVGNTEPFFLHNIVRQGTVYGPQLCIASMDKINILGKDVNTYYGPNLVLEAGIFIDDVTGMGSVNVANNLIYNCNIMEEKKKMTFNNKRGKTEYMVMGKGSDEVRTVTSTLKKGHVTRVEEHKLVGTWLDETGRYGINIEKKKEKLPYMIGSIKNHASPLKVGVYSAESRLRLAEMVIIPSILHDAEAFPQYREEEIKKLESIQLTILTGILEMPKTTPYYALLMEVGWWTMRARLAYRKLMLYHNIVRSNEKRPLRKILDVQDEEKRKTTWLSSVQAEMNAYNITLDPKETLKSTWKNEVKKKITEIAGREIRRKCNNSTKARIVRDDKYEAKEYLLGKVPLQEVKRILKMRMNMNLIPGNYKGKGEGMCPCTHGEGTTEHYFECRMVMQLRKTWDVKLEDLNSVDTKRMSSVANFMENVEVMIEPNQKRSVGNKLVKKNYASGGHCSLG